MRRVLMGHRAPLMSIAWLGVSLIGVFSSLVRSSYYMGRMKSDKGTFKSRREPMKTVTVTETITDKKKFNFWNLLKVPSKISGKIVRVAVDSYTEGYNKGESK